MRRADVFTRTAAAVVLLLAMVLPSGSARAAVDKEEVADVVAVRGKVLGVTSAGAEERLRLKSPIQLGTTVKTGARGRIQIRFPDDTLISLGRNTEMTIEAFEFNPSENKGKLVTQVQEGVFRVMGGAITKIAPENFKTKTPTATIGIRGSFYSGSLRKEELKVVFLGGRGITVGNSQGTVEIRTPSFGTIVESPNDPPAEPRPFVGESLDGLGDNPLGGDDDDDDDDDAPPPGNDDDDDDDAPPPGDDDDDDDNAPPPGDDDDDDNAPPPPAGDDDDDGAPDDFGDWGDDDDDDDDALPPPTVGGDGGGDDGGGDDGGGDDGAPPDPGGGDGDDPDDINVDITVEQQNDLLPEDNTEQPPDAPGSNDAGEASWNGFAIGAADNGGRSDTTQVLRNESATEMQLDFDDDNGTVSGDVSVNDVGTRQTLDMTVGPSAYTGTGGDKTFDATLSDGSATGSFAKVAGGQLSSGAVSWGYWAIDPSGGPSIPVDGVQAGAMWVAGELTPTSVLAGQAATIPAHVGEYNGQAWCAEVSGGRTVSEYNGTSSLTVDFAGQSVTGSMSFQSSDASTKIDMSAAGTIGDSWRGFTGSITDVTRNDVSAAPDTSSFQGDFFGPAAEAAAGSFSADMGTGNPTYLGVFAAEE